MALGLQVKLFNSFAIINSLCINLAISKNHTLPDSFVSFLEIDIQRFLIFYAPEWIYNFNFLAQLAFNYGVLTFDWNTKFFVLNLDIKHFRNRAFW